MDLRDGDVIRLNEVMKENVATIVFLYARWCTHCKLAAKTLEKVAERMKGKVKAYLSTLAHTHTVSV